MIHLLNKTGSCRSVFFTGEISPVSPVGGKPKRKRKKRICDFYKGFFLGEKIPPPPNWSHFGGGKKG
jgi:hypothetical protein